MENQQNEAEKKPSQEKKPAMYFMVVELGLEFAFMLLVPLLAFIYGGKWLDAKTSHHFFVIIGILLALALSSYLIYRKINEIRNMLK